ncbi:protein dispatched homolog 3-like [Acanthaster planci]|uniref:Protein dispatched homolog 3-like n=1 Tax=Acanthaster planci TaxID=133434 RepID=A0A8B7Y0G3_ACAPL|nr:protein dispatched homolog 3-like [Acanthaster planci]
MSGQLCFLTRHGPFGESLDEEVTFQTWQEESGEETGNPCGLVNAAFQPDVLDERQDLLASQPASGLRQLSNGRPKTFRWQQSPNESSSSSEGSFSSSQESLTEVAPLGQPWRALGHIFNSTIISIVILILVSAASMTLAGVSVFVVGPTPYFDKSLNAFQIPNHISTRRQLAFEAARKDDFHNLNKRSVDMFQTWHAEDDFIFKSPLHQTRFDTEGLSGVIGVQNALPSKETSNSVVFQSVKTHSRDFAATKRHRREIRKGQTNHGRSRRVANRPRSQTWRMQLIYMAKGNDKNIFTKERLQTIREVELTVMRHPRFTDFCSRNAASYRDPALETFKYCSPPISLMSYFYPSVSNGKVVYDGMGDNLADINGTLALAQSKKGKKFYWFVDNHMISSSRRSTFLRSEFWFGVPFGEASTPQSDEANSQIFKDFLVTYIDVLEKASTDKVRVLYGGTQLFDYQVAETISHDLRLCIPTGITIFILLFVLTSFSLWLTFWGFVSILFSFAWAYFIYHVAFGKVALGLLNLVSGFVIIGIGVDDVFVFVNTFLQADHYKDPVQRMAHTVKTAGIATFFTSFTTAGAFAANIASQIPAINDFGLFMCLIVTFCWILVMLVMPCALTLWQRCFHCEAALFRLCMRRSRDPAAGMARLSHFLDQHERQLSGETSPSETSLAPGADVSGQEGSRGENGDIPMLDLEEEANIQHLLTDDDDDPLILTNDDDYRQPATRPAARPAPKQARSITKALQVFLNRFVATPIIKGRCIVIMVYTGIFVISLVLVIHIKPAARPPALYDEQTNLQQLIDLAYNFSGKDITCKTCSGLSTEGGHAPQPVPGGPVTLPILPLPTRPPAGGGQHTVTHSQGLPPTRPPSVTSDPVEPSQPLVHTKPPDVHHEPTQGSRPPQATSTTTPVVRQTCINRDPPCGFHSTCIDSTPPGSPVCRCIFSCSDVEEPVCGSDGQTYKNICFLNKTSCERRQIIEMVYARHCFDPHTSSSGGGGGGTGGGSGGGSQGSNTVKPGGGGSGSADSPETGYNPCPKGSCGKPAKRPVLDNTALVYVVFGIDHFVPSNTSQEHVLEEVNKGGVMYDHDFDFEKPETMKALCKICKNIAARTELVIEGGAQCVPSGFSSTLMEKLALLYEDCRNLPASSTGSQALFAVHNQKVVWFAMAFKSTIFKGKSSFAAYRDYNAWETAIQEEKDALTEDEQAGLMTMFQTSDYWKQIFMEIVGVTSAIYGVAFSLLVCVIAVVIFTAHIGVLLIAFLTIGGVIMVVVSMFFLLGWEMGAVEAVSLSIIVGSSIDYCIHLIEGYLVAGDRVPDATHKSAAQIRRWRTRHSVSTIGVSILSSALTTVIATVPLCYTTIQLFAKFGKIVAMNTFVSILYTLTACTAFLSLAGPARYRWNLKWFIFSAFVLCCLIGGVVGILYALHTTGVSIPGPSGNPLF